MRHIVHTDCSRQCSLNRFQTCLSVCVGTRRGSFLASARGEERESRVSKIFRAVVEDRGSNEGKGGGAEGRGLAVTVSCTGIS